MGICGPFKKPDTARTDEDAQKREDETRRVLKLSPAEAESDAVNGYRE